MESINIDKENMVLIALSRYGYKQTSLTILLIYIHRQWKRKFIVSISPLSLIV